jgi:hypothetical protein
MRSISRGDPDEIVEVDVQEVLSVINGEDPDEMIEVDAGDLADVLDETNDEKTKKNIRMGKLLLKTQKDNEVIEAERVDVAYAMGVADGERR